MFARKLIAEEVAGTTILCLSGISAAVSVVAAGNEPAGLLIVVLAHGLALMVGIYAFGAISGLHALVTSAPRRSEAMSTR